MKRLSILFVLLTFAAVANAQNDYGGSGAFGLIINGDGWLRPDAKGRGKNSGSLSNIIKIKLDGIVDKKIGLGYERVLTRKITLSLDGLYQLPQNSNNTGLINFKTLFDETLNQDQGLKDKIDSLFPSGNYGFTGVSLSRWYVLPEVRYYFREAPRGFYTGVFFKYRALDYSNGFEYNNDITNEYYNYDVSMTMNTASIGLGFGVQTFITKNISLDMYFFGLQYSSNLGGINVNTTGTAISSDIQNGTQDAVNYINENFIVTDLLSIEEISDAKIELESRFTSPSIRLPSIRLGIRF